MYFQRLSDNVSTEENDSPIHETVMRIHRATGVPIARCQQHLEHLPLAHLSKLFCAVSQQQGRMFHDPLEDDPALAAIIKQVESEAEVLAVEEFEEFLRESGLPSGLTPGMGRCHHIWGIMQKLLRERHGIDWLTPAEMNPWVNID